MSVFSDTLTRYIEHKNIKVFSLAKYCNLDRSTMYKILNGKRNPPSSEVFEKMTQFMHLTPIEYNFLKETLEITQVGPDTLVSQQHIDYYIHQMILSESVHADGKIAMFIQPDYKFLFSLLASLHASASLKIDHIFCVGTEYAFTKDHQLINLKYLREIFPLYMAGLNYSLWYYYDRIQSHYYNFNLFPCMILTSDAAILCSSDYQNGIFIKSPDVVQLLWNQFISYKEQCSLFFRPAPLTPENHRAVIGSMFDTFYDQNDLIGIQPEPCLTPFFTGNLLHEIFNYDFQK